MDVTLTQKPTNSRNVLYTTAAQRPVCLNPLKGFAYQYAMTTLLVGASAVTTVIAQPILNRENDVMIFFVAAYLAAARFGLGPALWACALSIFCFDYFITKPVFAIDPLWGNHLFTFTVMFILIFAASERTARIRHYAATLEERVKLRTQELADSNEELRAEVARRRDTEEKLRLSLDEIARSNAVLQQFARIASHDLQEPLKVIQGYIRLLQKRYGARLDSNADEFMGFISDATERMERLIQGVLQHASVTSKVQAFESVESQVAFDEATANLQDAIARSGAEVVADNLPRISADRVLITQLFQNLIGNALKFQNKDAGTSPQVKVSARRTMTGWLFCVADNGIGIEPRHLEKVFKLFSRLHSATQYPGQGLGLAICKAVVDHHNGKIWVDSVPGKGSQFYFEIPDADQGNAE